MPDLTEAQYHVLQMIDDGWTLLEKRCKGPHGEVGDIQSLALVDYVEKARQNKDCQGPRGKGSTVHVATFEVLLRKNLIKEIGWPNKWTTFYTKNGEKLKKSNYDGRTSCRSCYWFNTEACPVGPGFKKHEDLRGHCCDYYIRK